MARVVKRSRGFVYSVEADVCCGRACNTVFSVHSAHNAGGAWLKLRNALVRKHPGCEIVYVNATQQGRSKYGKAKTTMLVEGLSGIRRRKRGRMR